MPALELVLTEMPFKPFNKVPKDPERDLYLPTFAAAISVGFLVMQILYKLPYPSNQRTKDTTQQSGNVSLVNRFQNHVSIIGGWTLFSFRLVRFAACVALAILSWLSVNTGSSQIDVFAYILTSTYVYTSFLAFISVVGTPEWGTIATGHLVPVLLVPWGVFVYRDVWPLATYTLIPADGDEGWFIWAKVFLLTLAAAIVPMTSPRRYIPVDPTDPMPKPNDEQTASWLSRSLFSYCDRTILKAYRQPHLTIDDLPVLADSEYTKNLVRRSYPHIDPLQKKNGHIFYGLVFQVFRREQIITLLTVIIRVCGSLVAPLGINRLLNFMETGGKNATVRPWFWIIWIFVGPMMSTLAYCTFFYCLLVIKIEGRSILTQMMFDHALRIRMKADVSNSSNSSDPTVVGEEHTRDDSIVEGDRESTTDPSQSTAHTTAKNKDKSVEKAKDALKEKGNLAGKINNLVTADFVNIENGLFWQMLVFGVPLQLTLSIFMLYKLLGWSVFPGIAVMVFAAPLPGYLTKLMHGIQTEKMKRSDARIQSVTETMNVIRMIKLFGWEKKMRGILGQKRNEELKAVRKMKMTRLSNTTINYLIPVLTTITTFTTYTLVMKKELTASLVFPALTIFSLIEEHFSGIFSMLPNIIQAKVSLDRINDFLHNTELLDKFVDDSSIAPTSPIAPNQGFESVQSISEEGPIGIRNSLFTWTADEETGGSMTPGGSHRRNFKLKIEDEVFFKKGRINLIIGPTGSGKTSLLMALLGEMHHIPLGPDALVSLPRKGGVAYHAQESWVLNETIKENILFGSPYDEARYETVIEQCALKHDLSLFEAGDLTEVGEKGITLSGGQKARVTLARAVYSHADILLLDDVLAALDVHTAKWIVERCLQGPLVQGRTVILVTHNIALASPIAEYVVSLGSDGRISSQGSLSNILAKDKKLSVEVAKKSKEIAEANMHVNEEKPDESAKKAVGKLIVEEEVELGHVGWNALKLLFSNMGGRGGLFLFWSSFVITATFFRMSTVYQMFIVTMWSDEYSHHPASEVSVPYYMTLYAACVLVTAISLFISYSIYVFGSIRATQTIHDLFMEKIFGTTLRWLDRTPASRIITRCTADIQSIDGSVTENFYIVVDLTLNMGLKFAAVVAVSPLFGGLGILLAIIGGTLGNVFIKAQLPIKRQSSNTNAPVMGHFSAAMTGLVSIRAYGAEEKFRLESFKRIDRMSRAARIFFDLNRWISVRTDALAWGFSAALAAYLTYGKSDIGSANTGFSLTMATGFSSLLLIWIRTFNLFETNGNSLERINQYLTIEQEPKPTSSGVPPAYWPASGDLRVENLSARYSADGPKVLRDISFHVKSGERIGIIGRTGSGKSSLTLALLRCILTEGGVYYDNILTNDINLDILRSNITIIPQVPELLSGTLRENLDPFSQYDDATLIDSLRAAGLFSLQNDTVEGKITLDTQIAAGGNNLSVGQRQILALARAIIRQSKLLILDEATSAIDYETDTIIQNSLRKELNKDVTLLTVAHRLQTIMDADKIMVLDSGRIVEFDKPSVLLQNEKGMLRALVDESEDKDKLYAMAAFQGTL